MTYKALSAWNALGANGDALRLHPHRAWLETQTEKFLRELARAANVLGNNYPPDDIIHFTRAQLLDVIYSHFTAEHVKKAIAKMSILSSEELRGKLYELNTHEIRWVLRQLHNDVKPVKIPGAEGKEGTAIASMQHGLAFKFIVDNYSNDEIEAMLDRQHNRSLRERQGEPMSGAPAVQIHVNEAEKLVPPTPPAPPRPAPQGKAELLAQLLQDGMTEERVNELIGNALVAAAHAMRAGVQGELQNFRSSDIAPICRDIDDLRSNVREQLKKLIEEIRTHKSTSLTITFPDERVLELGTVHRDQGELIKFLATGVNVFLTGPAGSGKSRAAAIAAKALEVPFYFTSVTSQTTETKFLGYQDAAGHYHDTQFRQAYAEGGLYLIDEIDNGNPNVLGVLNAALSGDLCAFPDKMVERHPKFYCVAAGNTWGTGKTIQYVGRNAIDAATLNRFCIFYWDYDEALETKLADLPEWSSYVQKCRAEVKSRGVNYLITPRASINGAKLLRAGLPVEKVVKTVLFPNMDPDLLRIMPKTPVISI